ncbi:hypothetical protein BKA81DRAFT_407647 [Phyllosticta paracitricarpa]|uniref:Uncharacterized protein n=2 Tax=Phyllosticta TaxID=121621 RepID=A0ABR1MR12_9PEZI
MVLEGTVPDLFDVFAIWLRARRLPYPAGFYTSYFVQDEGGTNSEELWDYLMSSAYVFATIYQVKEFGFAVEQEFEYRICASENQSDSYDAMPTTIALSRLSEEIPPARLSASCLLWRLRCVGPIVSRENSRCFFRNFWLVIKI